MQIIQLLADLASTGPNIGADDNTKISLVMNQGIGRVVNHNLPSAAKGAVHHEEDPGSGADGELSKAEFDELVECLRPLD